MLKQYRMAVIGAGCLMTALVATSLMSLENEKPTEDTEYILRAVKMIDDTQANFDTEQLVLECSKERRENYAFPSRSNRYIR